MDINFLNSSRFQKQDSEKTWDDELESLQQRQAWLNQTKKVVIATGAIALAALVGGTVGIVAGILLAAAPIPTAAVLALTLARSRHVPNNLRANPRMVGC